MKFLPFSLCAALLFIPFTTAGTSAADELKPLHINWSQAPDRHWLSPGPGISLWGNRLQDWQLKNGRLECLASQPRLAMRTAHLLNRRLGDKVGSFSMEVKTGLINAGDKVTPSAAVGFLIGVGGKEMHPWSAAIVHQWPGPGAGFFIGVTADGRPFIRDFSKQRNSPTPKGGKTTKIDFSKPITLKLSGGPIKNGQYSMQFRVQDAEGNTLVDVVGATFVPADHLIGNVVLVSHPGKAAGGKTGRFWFQDWKLAGSKFTKPTGRVRWDFGPIVSTQYTLSRGVLKLTAQMAPLGKGDNPLVELQVKRDGKWKTIDTTRIITPGWTATFRVPSAKLLPPWDATKDTPFRIRYKMVSHIRVGGEFLIDFWPNPATWEGTIRRDPVDKETIVVAGFTGNHNNAGFIGSPRTDWKTGMFFPHHDLTKQVAKHKPDLLFFSGDQVYEGRSPTFADSNPANIKNDYMYKWYLWCLAYRHLTKDIPAITIPDDHDVYQGNVWGQGGRKSPGRDHDGGYVHPADFVKMVERTQTSHLPDPFDPTPIEQGLGVYYTHLVWGRISVAVIEDRKFKSGCARPDMPKSGTGRPDHFNNPKFDIRKLDIPGVQLLGKRQLKFLHEWGQDWRGADMKLAVSQTIFANMATHHGASLQYLIADLDSNGWPQSGRNRAMKELRRCFAFHLAGDQHLATIVHHGIKDYGDAIWSFCVPSVANFYPRAWAPEAKGKFVYPKPEQYTGKRRDGFNHPVIVYAATNPGISTGHKPAALHDRMPGYGIVKFNKAKRTIRMECWPRWADPDKDKPYFGWPKTISQLDNYKRQPAGHLPTINVKGMTNPVVQVINQRTGETVYTLRINGTTFRPFVFSRDKHTIKVGELGTKRVKVYKGLEAGNGKAIVVDLSAGR